MIEQSMVELPHGITLSCRTAGERGRPVLMFLHGFPEAAFVWDHLLEHFAQAQHGGYRCIAPNLRGFEKSSAPPEVEAYRAQLLVQDITALIAVEGGRLDCLIAHDWGGAPAWSLANQHPQLLQRLAIINSPHAGTFQRELSNSPAQQAASAYMNFLIRPDAEKLLAEDDFRRLREFFFRLGAADGPNAWWTPEVEQQYREVWQAGLTGPLNYYRATPLRPPHAEDPGAAGVQLPRAWLTVDVPTLVLWAMDDIALPPALIDGLDDYVKDLELHRIEQATHWIVHEKPDVVIGYLTTFMGNPVNYIK
ncbi:MAG: alpha/beta fold hydrolase [Burkholderiales bacterium]